MALPQRRWFLLKVRAVRGSTTAKLLGAALTEVDKCKPRERSDLKGHRRHPFFHRWRSTETQNVDGDTGRARGEDLRGDGGLTHLHEDGDKGTRDRDVEVQSA